MPRNENDIKLSYQLKQGNQLAFSAVYYQYHKKLYSLAYRYLKDRDMTEDAVQHVFIQLWINRSRIDENQDIGNYLFVSLRNHVLNVIRNHRNALIKNYEVLIRKESAVANDDEDKQLSDQMTLIEKAAEKLSPQRKTIFHEKNVNHLSNQEIAQKLNISVNTVKFQYSQILKEIKEYMGKIKNYLLSLLIIFISLGAL